MSIDSAMHAFASCRYHRLLPDIVVSGMSRVLIHDARDHDIGKANDSQLRTPILAIPVGPDGIRTSTIQLLATAAQDICNFGASRRPDAIDRSYEGQPIDEAVATLTKHGLCVSPHSSSGKDGTFMHVSYDGFAIDDELHLQLIFDT